MNPYALAALFAFGMLSGALPIRIWYESRENARIADEQKQALEQERKNVEIVTHYKDLLSGVADWYGRNPVRVRIPGNKDCPGGAVTDAGSIVLTIPGYEASDGQATDSRLLGNDGASDGTH